jgi:tRNA(Ile)-lysidine synthase
LYHGAVPTLEQKVLHSIRGQQLLKAGDRAAVAVSGGADSVALLRLLLELRGELGVVLSVVHFNHKLRGREADADEHFVAELAARHRLELYSASGDVGAHAAEKHLSLEASARVMRYAYFGRLLAEGRMNRIATAHTLDDQAETVLLRLVRGSGTRGLAGIYPQFSVRDSRFSEHSGPRSMAARQQRQAAIVRPLLGVRRGDLESYLKGLGQHWREDSSNRDLRHARNRVRHGILPRLERKLNPAVRAALAETAEIARAEEDYWETEVARVLPQVREAAAGRERPREAGVALQVAALLALPRALERRVVRAAGECLGLRLEFRQVEEILAAASGTAKTARLPGGWVVAGNKTQLRFARVAQDLGPVNRDYEYWLPVPGQIAVPEADTRFEAALVRGRAEPEYNPENLLDAATLAKPLKVRNWRAGDHFWPAHTKSARKIKELLQERRVSGPERKLWPVVLSGDEVVWVRGFPTSARSRPRAETAEAVLIREVEE